MVFESVDVFCRVVPPTEYWGVISFLAFRYQYLCLVAYQYLIHHWPLLPVLGMGLEMPPPRSAEDRKRFRRICVPSGMATMYERRAWCCLTTTVGVHFRPCFIRTGSPSCTVCKVVERHGHRTLSDVVDVSANRDESER